MQSRRPKLFGVCLLSGMLGFVTATFAEPDSAGVSYFEKHIRPVLAERCYPCHSNRSEKRQGGLLLDSQSGWEVGGDRGAAVVPGDVEASLLIRALRYQDSDLQMPPDKALPPDVITHFEHWVRMGAPDPRQEVVDEMKTRKNPADPVAGREHWAFRPLVKPLPPATQTSDWARSPIDVFIQARLEATNLQPARDTDRSLLIRRLYFQLLGLPPTPEQVSEFIADDRPDAYPRLVEQLLGSRHFGERWGRHWLDLARYADSNGLDENFLFREAWRYRNWVIAAVNSDTPFDRFVCEQVAGDLLPFDSIEQRDQQRIGAGFLVVGPKVLLGNDDQKQRMEVVDEQLDTIGRAILGQTLGCARCHDHKFDPIPTADYYALAGILTSTQVMERRLMLNEQRVMERLVGLGTEGDDLDMAYEKYWRERPKLQEQQKRAKSALELLEKKDENALTELVKKHADALAAGAADTSQPIEQRIALQKDRLASLDAALSSAPKIPPRAMIPADRDEPKDEAIRLAGQFDRLGDKIPRGFLRVVGDTNVAIPSDRSGRLELAHWLTDPDHGAGRVAARVLANRVWHHLIGRGLVRTVDNFGRTGEAPSHPELLDYLACELIESGWSIKSLVRLIVNSRAFAMSSSHQESGQAVDPDNQLLWRAHRRRLDPESLRDAMLLAAGQLQLQPMDSTVSYLGDQATAVGDNKVRRRTDFFCRSLYLPMIRNDLPELFNVFDFVDPHATTGMRPDTMVATQGLFMLNDESVIAAAEATARRLLEKSHGGDEARIDSLFEGLLNQRATSADRSQLTAFVQKIRQQFMDEGHSEPELRAWSLVCHAVFASSRFQILE